MPSSAEDKDTKQLNSLAYVCIYFLSLEEVEKNGFEHPISHFHRSSCVIFSFYRMIANNNVA